MLALAFVALLLPQQVPPPPTTEAPATQPAVTYDQGPLRGEVVAMREIRFFAKDPEMAARMQSDLGIQFRIQGERITSVVRQGNLILNEVIDETGQQLVDPAQFTEQDKTLTRPTRFSPEQLRTNGLLFTTRAKPAARAAKTLKVVRGDVRLILATQTEKVTVDNPLQYVGKTVEHPRLKELGIAVQIVPSDQVENSPPPERSLAFKFTAKGDNVQNITFFDGYLKPVPARDTLGSDKTGEPVQVYYFDAAALNNEMQMVLDVHPQIEDIRVPIELKDFQLP